MEGRKKCRTKKIINKEPKKSDPVEEKKQRQHFLNFVSDACLVNKPARETKKNEERRVEGGVLKGKK